VVDFFTFFFHPQRGFCDYKKYFANEYYIMEMSAVDITILGGLSYSRIHDINYLLIFFMS
jgi:hypothetical protein